MIADLERTEFELKGIKFDIGAPVTGAVSIKDCIAASFGDGTVRFFRSDLEPYVVKAHTGVVLCMTSNGEYIFTGGDDGRFLQISLNGDVEEIANFGSRWVDTIAVHNDNLVCSSGSTAYVWSEGIKKPKLLEHSSTVGGIAIDQNGRRIAVSCYGGVTVWRLGDKRWKSSKFAWKGSHGKVSFSPDGKYLITAMQENELHGWRIRDKVNMAMAGYPGKIKSFAWVGDTPFLITSGARESICWPFDGKNGPQDRKPICLTDGGDQSVSYIEPLPGENAFFAGFRDGKVFFSEVDEYKSPILIQDATGSEITTISCLSDCSRVLIGDINGKVLWSPLKM